MQTLSKVESDRLLAAMRKSVERSELSQREVERRLGVSQGYLGGVLSGRIQLKVNFVYGLARVLGIEPLELFLAASPPKKSAWLLEQLGVGPEFLARVGDKLPSPRRMLKIVKRALRNEVERVRKSPQI
jgi:transcriptional regulator with XRE-family HTH domain